MSILIYQEFDIACLMADKFYHGWVLITRNSVQSLWHHWKLSSTSKLMADAWVDEFWSLYVVGYVHVYLSYLDGIEIGLVNKWTALELSSWACDDNWWACILDEACTSVLHPQNASPQVVLTRSWRQPQCSSFIIFTFSLKCQIIHKNDVSFFKIIISSI